jgi:hypothetical protein
MRRLVGLITVGLCAFGLIACGGDETPDAPTDGTMEKPDVPETTPDTPDTTPDAGEEPEAPKDLVTQATELLASAAKLIEKKDYDAAQDVMTKLLAMKDKLPEDMQKKIDGTAQNLAAKAAMDKSGVKLPGGG